MNEPGRAGLRRVETMPEIEVVAPVHEIVADAYDLIRHELKALRKIQRTGATLDGEDTKRLYRLMQSLARAQRAQLDAIESEDLGKLSREDLLRQLRSELGVKELKPSAG